MTKKIGLPVHKPRNDVHASQRKELWFSPVNQDELTKAIQNEGIRNRRVSIVAIVVAALVLLYIVPTSLNGKNKNGQAPTSAQEKTATQAESIDGKSDQMSLDDIEFHVKTTELEYSTKDIDPMSLIDFPNVVGLEVFTEDSINLEKVGEQKVVYIAKLDNKIGKIKATYAVRDTKSPTIKLGSKNVAIVAGDTYDPTTNIASVSDTVEGQLERVKESPKQLKDDKLARLYDKGFYLITGDFDANTPGKYFLTVEATDNHGNNKSKEFSITVEPAPIPEPAHETPVESTEEAIPVEVPAETEPQQPQQTYIINTNTHVYHHPSCRAVRQMKEDNKREFVGTSQEVQDMGYTPCQICYP